MRAYFYYPDNLEFKRTLTTSYIEPRDSLSWPLRIEYAGSSSANVMITWSPTDILNYIILLHAQDGDINLSEDVSYTFTAEPQIYVFNITATKDLVSPIITNITATEITNNSAIITWDTDENSNSLIKYGVEFGNYIHREYNATNVTSHSISITELSDYTKYYYVVNSTDETGNTNESVEYNFTTLEVEAGTPNITSFAPASPVTTIVCNWSAFNVSVNQTVNVSWYLNNSLLFTNKSITEANCTLHAEVVSDHNVSAIAENANGTDMQIWVWNVTAISTPPNEPSSPLPWNGAAGVSVSADLSWTGGDPDGDSVTYDVYFEKENINPSIVSSNQAGTTYDPGTLPYSSTYYWKIIAMDARGLINSSAVWSFTTESEPPINQPPTASFTVSPTYPLVGHNIIFNGSGSSDLDGTIVNYDWEFDDGNTSTGITVDHSYASAGTYTVHLTVMDNGGRTAIKTIDVQCRTEPTPGDINSDGEITTTDAAIVLEIAAGSRPCNTTIIAAADISGDGGVNSLDALMILQAAKKR